MWGIQAAAEKFQALVVEGLPEGAVAEGLVEGGEGCGGGAGSVGGGGIEIQALQKGHKLGEALRRHRLRGMGFSSLAQGQCAWKRGESRP